MANRLIKASLTSMSRMYGKTLVDDKEFRNRNGGRQEGYAFSFIILCSLNYLNYMDRYVPASVKDLIIDELNITDTESSLPATGMIVVYMFSALMFAWIDRRQYFDRRTVLCFAVLFWSFATFLAGLTTNLEGLVLTRSLVGVGDAAYSTIVPAMLCDYFPACDRNIVFGAYNLAIPVGGSIGYAIGGVIGQAFSWRTAFFVCGIPGFLAAFLVLRINNPVRMSNETGLSNQVAMTDSDLWGDFKLIMSNKHFIICLLSVIANNFALGGLADWMATFMSRYCNASVSEAGLYVGGASVIGGTIGTLMGAKLSKFLENKVKSAAYLVPAICTLPATALLCLVINISHLSAESCFGLFIVFMIFVWTFLAPNSAVSISVIPSSMRSFSSAIIIFFQHAFGDVVSPPIIGAISDASSLRNGLQVTWMMIFLSGCIWFYGYTYLDALVFDSSSDKGIATSKFVDIFRIEKKSGESVETVITFDYGVEGDESETYEGKIVKNPMIVFGNKNDEKSER